MKSKILALVAITIGATSSVAIDSEFIRRNVISETAQMQVGAIIELYADRSAKCATIMDGSISQACLERTFLEEVLNKRGYCQSLNLSDRGAWRPCLNGGSFGTNGTFDPGDFEVNEPNRRITLRRLF